MKTFPQSARPRFQSVAILTAVWLILDIGGLFRPGLLDDVDSIYIEVAREMLHRRDYVTPYIDGIRFFDKPPLMYWLAAGSMHLFGEHAWAARLPLALAVLGLLFSVYALGLRLFSGTSPAGARDRGGFYAALATATALGCYLYTRFFIPDILIALWMTLGVHLFLIAVDRAARVGGPENGFDGAARTAAPAARSVLLPSLGFAAVLALNLLTKGLIGLVFPLAFCAIYLGLTHQVQLLRRLRLLPSLFLFLLLALPWHVLAALRNPAIALPPGLGLPARAGWAWFYLYNEHLARFLGTRIPHDYGNTPVWIFWLYAIVWVLPWAAFFPAAFQSVGSVFRRRFSVTPLQRESAFALTIWAGVVMIFFTLSSRQEYYSLPALPAFTLLLGGVLAQADASRESAPGCLSAHLRRLTQTCHGLILLPLASVLAAVCLFFAIRSQPPSPGTDLASLLASHPALYNLSLGHLFDLTGAAMGLFRQPLVVVALGMLTLGPASFLLRRRERDYAANLVLAAGMVVVLLGVHEGLSRFYPVLGSRELAEAILARQQIAPTPTGQAPDLIVADGELTSASSLLFYTHQPLYLVNGRVNGPWFGSFWPDAPPIFETDATLRSAWGGPRRIFLLTYHPRRRASELAAFGTVTTLARGGGKTILSNR